MIPLKLAWAYIKGVAAFWREIIIVTLIALCGFLYHQRDKARDALTLAVTTQERDAAQAGEENALAALDRLNQRIAAITGANTDLVNNGDSLRKAAALIVKELNNAKPLDPTCRPDDQRMLQLSTQIDATNRATLGATPDR